MRTVTLFLALIAALPVIAQSSSAVSLAYNNPSGYPCASGDPNLQTIATKIQYSCQQIDANGNGIYLPVPVSSLTPPFADWYVDKNAGADTNDGKTALSAFATLRRPMADNQILYSQQFDMYGTWVETGAKVTANVAISGSDGTWDKVYNDASTGNHKIVQSYPSPLPGSSPLFAVCAKPDGLTKMAVAIASGFGVDLSAGTTFTASGITLPATGNYGVKAASATVCGNVSGAYQVWMVPPGSGAITIFLADASGAISYTGDNTSGVDFWGAQLCSVDSTSEGPCYYLQTNGEPVQTIAHDQTLAINGGNNVAAPLTYAETFRLGANQTNVKLQGYGAARPLVDGGANFASGAGSWTLVGGTTNCWSQQVTLDPNSYTATTADANGFPRAYANDALMYPYVASTALCDSTAGSYSVDSKTTLTPTFYIHPADNSDPNTNGVTYAYVKREFAIKMDGSGAVIDHVAARRANDANGSIELGQYANINDVYSYDGGKHDVYMESNSVSSNSKMGDCYNPDQGCAMLVIYDPAIPAGATFKGVNLTCEAIPHATVSTSSPGCFYAHGTGTYGTFTINNLVASNVSSGLSGGPGAWNINGFKCFGCSAGFADLVQTTTLTNCELHATAEAISFSGSSPTATITNCKFYGGSNNNGVLYSNVANTTINMSYSSIYPSMTGGAGIKLGATGGCIDLNHNVFDSTNINQYGPLPSYYLAAGYTCYNSDYNQFLRLGSASLQVGNLAATNYSLTQIQSTFSQELHSTYP